MSGRSALFRQARVDQQIENAMTPSEALAEALAIDLAEFEHQRVALYDWSMKVPEPKAGKLDFDRFPFQRELYMEAAADKEAVVKKATQVGVSAFLVRWTMYWADTKGLVALYVFPTLQHVYDFSDQRMTPSIDASEYLRSRISGGDVMNKGLKKIGLGFVYFRGSDSKRGLDSVDADVLALDEYDTLTQANIGDAERRISGSLTGLIRRVGVPSINDVGISKEYDKTDQRKWMVKCSACNEFQPITFKDNVALKDKVGTPAHEVEWDVELKYFIACSNCRKALDVSKGEWVAQRENRSIRGYHIPRLIVADTDLNKIVQASKEREPYKLQVHFNKDLAEAYEIAGGRLSRKEIAAAQREYEMVEALRSDNLITMGVDVASARSMNAVICEHLSDGKKKVIWAGNVEWFGHEPEYPKDELCLQDLMRNYDVNMAVIDHAPEERSARSLSASFPGRVYLVKYQPPSSTSVFDVDETTNMASVKRVPAIDTVIAAIRQQKTLLPSMMPEDFVDQLIAVVRRVERDEFDKVTVTYESTGADDYMHAMAYEEVACACWDVRQVLNEADGEEFTTAENLGLDFDRSDLGDYSAGNDDYSPGRDADDYSG